MKYPTLLATFGLLVTLMLPGCGSDEGGGDGDGDGDGDAAGDGDGDAADGGATGDGDASGDGDSSEAPADCSILEDYVGDYTVTGPATGEEQRGESTAEHMRGTISIGADYSIDFDTDISFGPIDIVTCYDRTAQDFDRRVQVSYGADDNGEVINIYLTDSLEVEEIQYRHNTASENVRVLVE